MPFRNTSGCLYAKRSTAPARPCAEPVIERTVSPACGAGRTRGRAAVQTAGPRLLSPLSGRSSRVLMEAGGRPAGGVLRRAARWRPRRVLSPSSLAANRRVASAHHKASLGLRATSPTTSVRFARGSICAVPPPGSRTSAERGSERIACWRRPAHAAASRGRSGRGSSNSTNLGIRAALAHPAPGSCSLPVSSPGRRHGRSIPRDQSAVSRRNPRSTMLSTGNAENSGFRASRSGGFCSPG